MKAKDIAEKLGGQKQSGAGWMCKCPVHDDKHPSLFIVDDSDNIQGIQLECLGNCDFKVVRDKLVTLKYIPSYEEAMEKIEKETEKVEVNKPDPRAQAIWNTCVEVAGTPAELYLVNRGFDGAYALAPPTLRYHPGLRHPDVNGLFPCMVAAVQLYPSPEVHAIHRHYITLDGFKQNIDPPKASLGKVKGGAVRLAPLEETLAICEGVETGLSILQHLGLCVWSAISAPNMESLIVPMGVKNVIIFADNDKSGRGLNAAKILCVRLKSERKVVTIRMPPTEGTDYNDYFN